MTSIWQQAQTKQAARRDRGVGRAAAGTTDAGVYMDLLVKLGTRFHKQDEKGNNTTAVGIVTFGNGDPGLYLSFKGPKNPGENEVLLAAQDLEIGVGGLDDIHILGNESGLHSEMAIVRAATGGDRSRLAHEEFYMEIACIGKGVCPDCSGFLLKHHIPHTKARAKVGSDWVNPFTGAHYTGSAAGLQYIKAGKTFTGVEKPVVYKKGWAKGK